MKSQTKKAPVQLLNATPCSKIEACKNKIQIWNDEYNNLEHCGLNGKTPIEMLQLFKLEKVS